MAEDERRRYRLLRGAYAYMGSSPFGNKIGNASGSIASFDTDLAAPLISLFLHIEPHQEGTGDPSPENVRPITGYTGVNVYVSPTGQIGDAVVYPISFAAAGTVYGGTLDVTKGTLTVDRALITFTTSNSSVTKSSLTALDIFLVNGSGKTVDYVLDENVKLDKFHFVNRTSTQGVNDAWKGTSATQLRIGFSTYGTTTLAQFKEWLDANTLQMVATLATPQTYQLTPTEVRTLIGTNNIFMDADGTVNVEYQYRS